MTMPNVYKLTNSILIKFYLKKYVVLDGIKSLLKLNT